MAIRHKYGEREVMSKTYQKEPKKKKSSAIKYSFIYILTFSASVACALFFAGKVKFQSQFTNHTSLDAEQSEPDHLLQKDIEESLLFESSAEPALSPNESLSAESASPNDTEQSSPVETPLSDAMLLSEAPPYENSILFFSPVEMKDQIGILSPEVNADDLDVEQFIYVGEQIPDQFKRENPLFFSNPLHYQQVPGILTFRGNNFRNAATWGFSEISEQKLSPIWEFNGIGGRLSSAKTFSWSGTGWTGQPLIIQWDKEVRQFMNLYEQKKDKDGLIEVIIAAMDGNVYFFDLEDGEKTRDSIFLGASVKGTPAVDPRGFPLLYTGHGDLNSSDGKFGFQIHSLINGELLYYQSCRDSRAFRPGWGACDSSPIISGESDMLIYPSENGMIYTLKLNTEFDQTTGTISINPESINLSYRLRDSGFDGIGIESSISFYNQYGYFCDNGGKLVCIDLNSMKLIWVRQLPDDSDVTPVLSEENGNAYLYIGTEVDWQREDVLDYKGEAYAYKISAMTGEIVWQNQYSCATHNGRNRIDDINGGLLATPVSGKNKIDHLIIYSYCMTEGLYSGNAVVAYDKQTGQEVWQYTMPNYSWSSPVDLYDDAGNGYIIIADSGGSLHLIDGMNGSKLDILDTGPRNFESSPSVFGNTLVIGSRSGSVHGIKIS